MDLTVTVVDGAPDDIDLDELVDNARAAHLAGVAESTIRRWVFNGDLTVAGYIGPSPRYTAREVARCEKAKRGPRTPLRRNPAIALKQIEELRARMLAA